MRLSWILASALVLTLPAASAGAAELITNGGFESGNFTAVGPFNVPPVVNITTYDLISQSGPQDLTGWTVGNSLVWGFKATDINTHAGIGFVDLTGIGDLSQPHGILNQTIPTIVSQQYTFSVFATQDFRGSIGFDVLANNVALVLSGTPGFWDYTPTGATYGQISGQFTASSNSTTISIVGRPFSSFMIGLDDVSVTGPAVSQTPVPGALPLFATGLGVLGFFAQRRKRKTLTA